MWVHPAVEVRDSPIAGRGLFTTAPIADGTVLIRFGGTTVSTAGLHELLARATLDGTYVDSFALDDDTHLVLPAGTSAHFANHSCDPTSWLVGPLELAARRDLDRDIEVTSDYGVISDDASFHMVCTCAASACRRVVTGRDWQRLDLQATHRGHWPPGPPTTHRRRHRFVPVIRIALSATLMRRSVPAGRAR